MVIEALRHKTKQSVDGRRKYELVAKVLAGESNRTTAIAAGIDKGPCTVGSDAIK